jgi:hypothetical protein
MLPEIVELLPQAPLYDMITEIKKLDGPLQRSDSARICFDTCRQALADTTQLMYPSTDAAFRLSTNASNTSVGAVLEQEVDEKWQPLGFFSKKLSPTERTYNTYNRKLLAAYLGMSHFIYLIEG